MGDFVLIGEPRANKTHTCDICTGQIEPGAVYQRETGRAEGSWFTFKGHLGCNAVLRWWLGLVMEDVSLDPRADLAEALEEINDDDEIERLAMKAGLDRDEIKRVCRMWCTAHNKEVCDG